MSETIDMAAKEKRSVALSSVFASMFLTAGKLVVGLSTGSLGILSEAAHSALDFGAAVITYFAVRISDKPPDQEHHYGHGKIENFSALIAAVLLLATCILIIKEALHRLVVQDFTIHVTFWGFAIIIVSILVDYSRARALNKAARKYNSQALEADALHFTSDIFSSLVVLVGLSFAKFGFEQADPIAALIVAVLVIVAGVRLAKKTVDGLMDRAPSGLRRRIEADVQAVPGVKGLHKIRVRQVGPKVFGDLHILVDGNSTVTEGHTLAHKVEAKLAEYASDMVIHIEPTFAEDTNRQIEATPEQFKEKFKETIERAIEDIGILVDYHEFCISFDPDRGLVGGVHLILPKFLPLNQAHSILRSIENQVIKDYPGTHLDIRLEPCDGSCTQCHLDC